MIKIWGRNNSINVQKVMWILGELELEHERYDAGLAFGQNQEDWYLKENPNGLVPLLNDNGFTLWESNTMVRYLAAKYGDETLCPPAAADYAHSERWMDWQITVLAPPMMKLFWQLVRTPKKDRDTDAIEQAHEACVKAFQILDDELTDSDYIFGNSLTVGDIPVGAMTYRWLAMEIERPQMKNLQRWYEALVERPAFRQHVMLPLT